MHSSLLIAVLVVVFLAGCCFRSASSVSLNDPPCRPYIEVYETESIKASIAKTMTDDAVEHRRPPRWTSSDDVPCRSPIDQTPPEGWEWTNSWKIDSTSSKDSLHPSSSQVRRSSPHHLDGRELELVAVPPQQILVRDRETE